MRNQKKLRWQLLAEKRQTRFLKKKLNWFYREIFDAKIK